MTANNTRRLTTKRILIYHALALLTVIIWGTTFVSTKILINKGLSPIEIFFYRFIIAYFCMLLVSHKKFRAKNLKDEWLFLICGLSGGSLYFVAENTALGITLASNVSLLICTAPIITAILSYYCYKEPFRRNLLYGSVVALIGIGFIVFNGNVLLKINPLGDLLTLFAAASWASYCLVIKKLSPIYPTLFITRKVFFYGIVTLCFYFTFYPLDIKTELLMQPVIYLNILFLGLIASMLCYIMWNSAVSILGASKTANYIYIVPLVTLLTSAVFLQESITIISIIGACCIIGGVYLAERQ